MESTTVDNEEGRTCADDDCGEKGRKGGGGKRETD